MPLRGFIGTFEVDPEPDGSHTTIEIGRTGSDHRVAVELFDDGGTICLVNFGEFSTVSLAGIGTRVDPTHISILADFVCHTSGGDRGIPASPPPGVWEYLPDHDVIVVGGLCHWRVGRSVADCP